LSTAAALHLLASISNAGPFVEFPDTDKFKDQLALVKTGIKFKESFLLIPQGAGLGIEIDEEAVKGAVVKD
jgi:L-alanine-DL-glutamate epimerase-like enolase superfamily enzyme